MSRAIRSPIRAQAVLYCDVMASNPHCWSSVIDPDHIDSTSVAESLGVDDDALELAEAAWWAVIGWDWVSAEREAEAAAMLRDGWSPGDPVEVRSAK